MKILLRSIAVSAVSFYLTGLLVDGIKVSGGLKSYLLAGTALALLNITARPIINLLLLPINVLTLGMFRWLVNSATLWLVSIFIGSLTIAPFTYPGFSYQGLVIPAMEIGFFWTLTLGAFFISLFSGFFDWIARK